MPFQLKAVTINGKPGTDVTIHPRDRGDEPPPPAFEGAINSHGHLMVYLPPGPFAVVSSSSGTIPLQIEEGGPASFTFTLA